MSSEPPRKRVVAFIDGQNLFHHAKAAFGCSHPNFNPRKLSQAVCAAQEGWDLLEVRFYTGVPERSEDPFWHGFWVKKIEVMKWDKVVVFSRPLRYRSKNHSIGNNVTLTQESVGTEKGVDVRIALDILRMGYRRQYDVALIFSQDQDFSEVANEIRELSREQKRWINISCAYPYHEKLRGCRGVNSTDWIRINKDMYGQCVDVNDYRPRAEKKAKPPTGN